MSAEHSFENVIEYYKYRLDNEDNDNRVIQDVRSDGAPCWWLKDVNGIDWKIDDSCRKLEFITFARGLRPDKTYWAPSDIKDRFKTIFGGDDMFYYQNDLIEYVFANEDERNAEELWSGADEIYFDIQFVLTVAMTLSDTSTHGYMYYTMDENWKEVTGIGKLYLLQLSSDVDISVFKFGVTDANATDGRMKQYIEKDYEARLAKATEIANKVNKKAKQKKDVRELIIEGNKIWKSKPSFELIAITDVYPRSKTEKCLKDIIKKDLKLKPFRGNEYFQISRDVIIKQYEIVSTKYLLNSDEAIKYIHKSFIGDKSVQERQKGRSFEAFCKSLQKK